MVPTSECKEEAEVHQWEALLVVTIIRRPQAVSISFRTKTSRSRKILQSLQVNLA